MAAEDRGNDVPEPGATVLIRAEDTRPGATGADGRAHYLAVVEGERAGLRVELGGKPVVIGRVPPADLVIDDSQISRNHCRVNLVQDEVFVTDLKSSNGTMVDGKRISATTFLPPGARLEIGSHVLEHEFRSRKEVEASKELDRDLDNARRYVQSLLPPPLAEGPLLTEWVLLPCAKLGGDVFGYHPLDARTYALFLLDVSGHGTGSAMHAVSVANILRRDALTGVDMHDPAKVAAYLNKLFQMSTHGGLYLTLWYGVYDVDTRTLHYCSAGHHPSFLVAEPRERAIPLRTPNLIIGATPGFDYRSASVYVPPGARLYVFSDGIFEIEAKDGQQWNLQNVLPLIVEPPVEGVTEPERLLRAIRGHAKRPEFEDDFTVLVATFP